jgi:hypothetical protein
MVLMIQVRVLVWVLWCRVMLQQDTTDIVLSARTAGFTRQFLLVDELPVYHLSDSFTAIQARSLSARTGLLASIFIYVEACRLQKLAPLPVH